MVDLLYHLTGFIIFDIPLLYQMGQRNPYKTETFLFFEKIMKKLIITDISIINYIIKQ